MSIAEKTLLLKQDFDEVHAKGYEDGKNSVVDFARYIYNQPQFTSLNIFRTKEAVLNLDSIRADGKGSLFNMFNADETDIVNTTVEHLTINCPAKVKNIQQMLYAGSVRDNTLKRVTLKVDLQLCTNAANAFGVLMALETIDGTPLNFSSITTASNINAFASCGALQEVRFVPNSIKVSIKFNNSSLLSTDTIQSIIDGLADLTGSTAQTLTLRANVGAKLTDEQKATITAKNWELVY